MFGNPAYGTISKPGETPISPEVQQWFQAVDRDHSGQIKWEELQSALVNAQGEHFSPQACKLMIGMFDVDKTGTIAITEFQLLYNYINQWMAVFKSYDTNNSGDIEEQELTQAFQQMGYKFSPEFFKFLIARSDLQNHQRISVDQFIVLCVQIQRLTEAFRARDQNLQGTINIPFEDFVMVAINCTS